MEFFSILKELAAPLIILQIIAFAAIIFVLRKLIYSASAEEMNRLKKLEEEHLKTTADLTARLEEAERQSKIKINAAENEARRIAAQAKLEVEKLREEALAKARQESERIVSQALNTKNKIKEEMEARMRERCAALSEEMIRKIFGSKHQRAAHEGFIDEMIEELEKIDGASLNVIADKGEIITPYELDGVKKEKIISIISRKTGKRISISEKIDKSAMAGAVIKFGSLVIDGSLSGRLKDAYEG